jgi:hypothetical protein
MLLADMILDIINLVGRWKAFVHFKELDVVIKVLDLKVDLAF